VAEVPACVERSNLSAIVRITAFDAFGNRVTRAGDNFQIRVGSSSRPSDIGDGTYTGRLNLDTLPVLGVLGARCLGVPFDRFVPRVIVRRFRPPDL
jgi:hypothetical protein